MKKTNMNGACSTGTNQQEFPSMGNTIFRPRAAVGDSEVKKPRGRPPGPRGFFVFIRLYPLQALLAQVVSCLRSARLHASQALILRRKNGDRCSFARVAAFCGRHSVFAASCWAAVAFFRAASESARVGGVL